MPRGAEDEEKGGNQALIFASPFDPIEYAPITSQRRFRIERMHFLSMQKTRSRHGSYFYTGV